MSLEARSIGFSYAGGCAALAGVSLSVEPGECVALTGASGAGKTTLCRVLAGFVRPQAGEVLVDGEPLLGSSPELRAPRPVQLIWQHPVQAFDPRVSVGRSVGEGVGADTVAATVAALAREGLLARLGLEESWLRRLPRELSGGELMRCNIARALLAHPRYLLCDEMTASLDMVVQAHVWRAVLHIAQERGMGLVVVTHDEALAAHVAARRVQLRDARLIECV